MDGRGFDDLVRRLGAGHSRRSVLRGLLGGSAALLASRSRGALAGPADKVDICHLDEEGIYRLISINGNAVEAHLAHGDQFPDDCEPGCACCIPNFVISCVGNEECCSGICQGGQCVPTLAGTCPPGANICTESGAECGGGAGEGACVCVTLTGGDNICIGNGACFDSCDDCPEGFLCDPDNACCDDGDDDVTCLQPCPPEGGVLCFTGETRIAMADGTSRPISGVSVGEAVLGADGRVNHVEAVMTPRLGGKPLYALNGSGFFVTAEHPFMTEDGWKAIDPTQTARTHPDLQIGRLMVGDRLLALSGVLAPVGVGGGWASEPVEVRFEPVLLERIESASDDPATPLYNLRLDGNQTYFANDLLVHNK